MGLSSTTNRVSFVGDGSSTIFSFPYYFFNPADLQVYLFDINSSAVAAQTLNTNYTVSGNINSQGVYPSGGNVVMNSAFPASLQIVITRSPSPVQNFVLGQNGPINSLALVQQLDYLTTLVQRLQDEVSRSVQIPDGLGSIGGNLFSTNLPSNIAAAAVAANSPIVVNSAATGLTLGFVIGSSGFSGTVPVANGGTGQNSLLTQYALWYSQTQTQMGQVPSGVAGLPLLAQGSASPSYQSLSLAGSGVTGVLQAASVPPLGSSYVRTDGVSVMTGNLNLGSNNINNVLDPTTAQQAATKSYVDTVASALNPIQACYAASNGSSVVGTYLNGVAGLGATFTLTGTGPFAVDTVLPPVNSRILLKDQSSGFQNGIYNLTVTGSGIILPNAVLTRALDYDTASNMNSGDLIPITNGSSNQKTAWLQTATINTVGVDSLVFTEWLYNLVFPLTIAQGGTAATTANAAFVNLSPMTTRGDIIITGSSGAQKRFGVGSDGTFLKADSTQPDGLIYASPAGVALSTTTKVANYNATSGDNVIFIASGCAVVNLYGVSGNTGNLLRLIKIGAGFDQCTINASNASIVHAGSILSSITAATQNEAWTLVVDGSSGWTVLDHITKTAITTTTNTFTCSSNANPGKGTIGVDQFTYWRDGRHFKFRSEYAHTLAGSTGSNTDLYLGVLPAAVSALVMDSSVIKFSVATGASGISYSSITHVGFVQANAGGATSADGAMMVPYDSTRVRFVTTVSKAVVLGGTAGWTFSGATQMIQAHGEFPVLGWLP